MISAPQSQAQALGTSQSSNSENLQPLSLPYMDVQRRITQLWKYKNTLVASLTNEKGEISVIPRNNIHNALIPKEGSVNVLNRIEKAGIKKWHLAYIPESNKLYIWPFLIAAAGGNDDHKEKNYSKGKDPVTFCSKEHRTGNFEMGHHIASNDGSKIHFKSEHGKDMYNLSQKNLNRNSHRGAQREKLGYITRMKEDVKRPFDHQQKIHEARDSLKNKMRDLVNQLKYEQAKEDKADTKKLDLLQNQIAEVNKCIKDSRKFFPDTHKSSDTPKKPDTNKSSFPKGPTDPKGPATKDFQQKVQQTRLTDSYNSTHKNSPIPAKGASGGDIGGVACGVDYIEGLFESPEALFEQENFFYLPGFPDGKAPFSNLELRQIMRELAIGVYVHSTTPFFSLHFNQQADLFPVIHPAYENTLVGRVISMLDYMMKGYLNGGIYQEKFIDEWHQNPDWSKKSGLAVDQLIDFGEYCQKLDGEDFEYRSLRTLQQLMFGNPKDFLEKMEEKVEDLLGLTTTQESQVLKNYTGFSNSFRIIAKQNSIQKEGNLFKIDADFDVLYTINPSPEYKDALNEHLRKYGTLPSSYVKMEIAYKFFCKRIHDHMVKIPLCKDYFAMLSVISFISSYFSTLKQHRKIPVLPSLELNNSVKGCPPLFPHLPIGIMIKETLKTNFLGVIVDTLKQHRVKFEKYFNQRQKDLINGKNQSNEKEKQELLEIIRLGLCDNILKTSSFGLRRLIKQNIDHSKEVQKEIKKTSTMLLNLLDKKFSGTVNESTSMVKFLPYMFKNQTMVVEDVFKLNEYQVINKIVQQDQVGFDKYFFQLYKDLINSVDSSNAREESTLLQKIRTGVEENIFSLSDSSLMQWVRSSVQEELFTELSKGLLDHLNDNVKKKALKMTSLFIESIIPKLLKDEILELAEIVITQVRIKSELQSDEVEKGKKVVGGCGVRLEKQAIQASKIAANILYTNLAKLKSMNPESWTEMSFNAGKSKGFAFRLLYEEVPAWINDNYEWMESLLLVPAGTNAELIEERLKLQELMSKGEKKEFVDRLHHAKKLSEMKDKYQRTLMHEAAGLSDPSYVEALLKVGLSVSSEDVHGYQPIHYAAMNGAILTMQFLLKSGDGQKMVNAYSRNRSTPLIVAIQHGQLQAVQFLLAQGALFTKLAEGYNTLHCVLHHGDFSIIEEVLKNKALTVEHVNELSEEGGTPLMLACELDSPQLVEKLIALKADPKIKRKDGVTAFEIAVIRNCRPVAECLLKYAEPAGHAVETAAKEGSLEILGLMIDKSYFYNYKNSYDDTALHTAARFGNIHAALFIIKHCQNIHYLSALNAGKETTFSLAAGLGAWILVEELLNKNAVSSQELFSHFSPLLKVEYNPVLKKIFDKCNFTAEQLKQFALIAAQAGNYQALSYIFEPKKVPFETLIGPNDWRMPHYLAKCDALFLFRSMVIKEKNLLQPLKKEDNKTLPYIAGASGSSRVLRFLLDWMKKENISLEAQFKDRHLLYAIIGSVDLQCVQMFFEVYKDKKKDLANVVLDGSGLRPLHLAAKKGSLSLIKLLVQEGADLKARDMKGNSPLCYALLANAELVISYLLDQNPDTISAEVLVISASLESDIHFKKLMQLNRSQDTLAQALFLAIKAHHPQASLRLYQHKAAADLVLADGWTAFLLASATGQSAILSLMLQNKLLKDAGYLGNNALQLAAMNGYSHCVNMLMDSGYKNEKNNKGVTPLDLSKGNFWLKQLFTNKETYQKAILYFSQELMKAKKSHDFELLISKISALPLNESIEIEYGEEKIWGTPLQLLLEVCEKAVISNSILKILQRNDLNPDIQDSQGNTLAHLLLKADISPVGMVKINWKIVNHKQQNLIHFAALHSSLRTLQALLDELKQQNLLYMLNAPDEQGFTPVFYTVVKNKENTKLFIDYGADLNVYDNKLMTLLTSSYMCPNPSLTITKQLLAGGANPNQVATINHVSPIRLSLFTGNDEFTRCLLLNGANCRILTSNGNSLMHTAAGQGKTHLLGLLSTKGLLLETRNNDGVLPIHMAASQGKTKAVAAILSMQKEMLNAPVEMGKDKKNEKINKQEQEEKEDDEDRQTCQMQGATPLHIASNSNQYETMEYLLKHKADPEITTKRGSSVLSDAAGKATRSTIDLFSSYKLIKNPQTLCSAISEALLADNLDALIGLYQRGIPISAEILAGYTGIQLASRRGSLLSTQWLLQQGADYTHLSPTGEDSLQLSAVNDSHEQFELLLEFVDPDLDEVRNNRETLMHTAARAGKLNQVMFLIKNFASLNIKDSKGNLPIHYASQYGHSAVVGLLLACGADGKAKSGNEKSPKELIKNDDKNTLKVFQEFEAALASAKKEESLLHLAIRSGNPQAVLLLSYLEDVDHQNCEGSSPLHLAAESGQTELCKILLRAGANIELKDNSLRTPVNLALKNLATLELLINAGASFSAKDNGGGSHLESKKNSKSNG